LEILTLVILKTLKKRSQDKQEETNLRRKRNETKTMMDGNWLGMKMKWSLAVLEGKGMASVN
jgi:hypothetical protein